MNDTEYASECLNDPTIKAKVRKSIEVLTKYRIFGYLREVSDFRLKVALEKATDSTNALIVHSAKKYGYITALEDLQALEQFEIKKITTKAERNKYGTKEEDLE